MGGSSSKKDTQHGFEAKALCKAAIKGAECSKHPEEEAIRIFQQWDKDNNGSINKEELFQLFTHLGLFPPGEETERKKVVNKLLDDIDSDRNDSISYHELVAFIFQGPYLTQYLEYSKKVLVEHMQARIGVDGDQLKELIEKQQAQLEKEITPLIKKAFGFHDKDNSGKLEKCESVIFFSNYVAILPKLQTHLIFQLDTSSVTETMKAIELYDKWQEDCKDREKIDKRFQAAFSLLDLSKDGMLEEDEVVAGLLHGTKKNLALLEILECPTLKHR